MAGIFTKLIDLIYENNCLICNQSASKHLVCTKCENSFIKREKNYKKEFKHLTIYSWGLYEGKLREGIIQLKSGKKKLAKYFANKLVEFWRKINIKFDNLLVVPVPSHKNRVKGRGYCQTSLIAMQFAQNLNLRFSNDLVIRNKETIFMNKINNIKDRKKNIKEAFKLKGTIKEDRKSVV